tara:strand:+ start:266 stop:451 length:186 start_codon:yes stop_codon:yes gene_type:complete
LHAIKALSDFGYAEQDENLPHPPLEQAFPHPRKSISLPDSLEAEDGFLFSNFVFGIPGKEQ